MIIVVTENGRTLWKGPQANVAANFALSDASFKKLREEGSVQLGDRLFVATEEFWCSSCDDPMECGSWAACLKGKS